MLDANELQAVVTSGRTITQATPGDPALGDLTQLPGTWANADNLAGHGWNMIALPTKNLAEWSIRTRPIKSPNFAFC